MIRRTHLVEQGGALREWAYEYLDEVTEYTRSPHRSHTEEERMLSKRLKERAKLHVDYIIDHINDPYGYHTPLQSVIDRALIDLHHAYVQDLNRRVDLLEGKSVNDSTV